MRIITPEEISRCTYSDVYVQIKDIDSVLAVSEMLKRAPKAHQKADYMVRCRRTAEDRR